MRGLILVVAATSVGLYFGVRGVYWAVVSAQEGDWKRFAVSAAYAVFGGAIVALTASGYFARRRRSAGRGQSLGASPRPVDASGLKVRITERARRVIKAHGGTVFLWQSSAGSGYAYDRIALHRPDGVEFESFPAEPYVICIADDIQPPYELRIRRSLLLPGRVVAYWNGGRWGWRGSSAVPTKPIP